MNFAGCRGLTGTAESSGTSDGQKIPSKYLFNRFFRPAARPPFFLTLSFFLFFFTGTLVTLPPASTKVFNIKDTFAKIDVAAIEWPANATALVHDGSALVCRTTDPDESKEGAETGEIRIVCTRTQVIGTSSVAESM